MRWLADECVAAELVKQLRSNGHDVVYAAETLARASDGDVLARAHEERRLLLTEDKDFGDLVFRQSRLVPGVVLLRVNPLQATRKWELLQGAMGQLGEGLFGRYTVVDERKLRSRPLPSTN